MDYRKPTPLGPELEIRARVVERSDRKAIITATVAAGGVVTVRGEIVAVRRPEGMAQPE